MALQEGAEITTTMILFLTGPQLDLDDYGNKLLRSAETMQRQMKS